MSDNERASLPDRVEAAAKARHEAQFPNTPWRVMSEPTKSHDRELMAVALAAADACEAERNPNTTDDEIIPIGWNERGEPAFMRRAVSSEDVHRGAAE